MTGTAAVRPDLILNPESEVVIFFGAKGKGKSSLMAHFADYYLKKLGPQRQELSEQLIREEIGISFDI